MEERIVKKSLDIIVLKFIHEKPLSGYSLILLIRERFSVKLSAGTVYSLLHSLQKKGLLKVNSEKEGLYELTKKGEETLIVLMKMQTRIKTLNHDIFERSLFKQIPTRLKK